jgi:hypothetical protein
MLWPLWCLPLLGAMGLQDTPAYHVLFHSVGIPDELRPTAQLMARREERWLCHVPLLAIPGAAAGPGDAAPALSVAPPRPLTVLLQISKLLGPECHHAKQSDSEWWGYEFCPGKWVRQYHVENGAVIAEHVLGLGPDALLADALSTRLVAFASGPQTMQQRLAGRPRPTATGQWEFHTGDGATGPYYETAYRDGDVCDVSGRPREVEVRILCAADPGQDLTFALREKATCLYLLLLRSTVACGWPEMRAAAAALAGVRRGTGADGLPSTEPIPLAIQCYADAPASAPRPSEERIPIADAPFGGVPVPRDAIADAFDGTCAYRFGSWWGYHFCWDRWLRQYRTEGDRVAAHHLLGVGPQALIEDFHTTTPIPYTDGERTLQEDLPRPPLQATGQWYLVANDEHLAPHYATLLPQGEFCPAEGVPRRSTVRLFCAAAVLNATFEVVHPEPCESVLSFRSTVPCGWPDLRAAFARRSLPLPFPDPGPGVLSRPTVPVLARPNPPADAPVPQEPQVVAVAVTAGMDATFGGVCHRTHHGWWAYEWCHDKWVRQFHQEQGVVLSEYFLGLGTRAKAEDAIGRQKVAYADGSRSGVEQLAGYPSPRATGRWVYHAAAPVPYYSTVYSDGTPCEGGQSRRVEVRLVCGPDNETPMQVTEPEACTYTLTVAHAAVCAWPPP